MESAAVIYIILAVNVIFLFMLTRPMSIRIEKSDYMRVTAEFTLFALEFKKNEADGEKDEGENSTEGEMPLNFGVVFSLLSKVLRHLGRCGIRIRKLIIPRKEGFSSFWTYFRYMRLVSVLFAYIDSRVESLIIDDNAFILSSDKEKIEFDITFRTVPLNLIILGVRLIFDMIKLRKMEKVNVGN